MSDIPNRKQSHLRLVVGGPAHGEWTRWHQPHYEVAVLPALPRHFLQPDEDPAKPWTWGPRRLPEPKKFVYRLAMLRHQRLGAEFELYVPASVHDSQVSDFVLLALLGDHYHRADKEAGGD